MKKPTVIDYMSGTGGQIARRNALASMDERDAQMRHDELIARAKKKKRKKEMMQLADHRKMDQEV